MSVNETAAYTGIGRGKIRELMKKKDCNFMTTDGYQVYVIIDKFVEFLNQEEEAWWPSLDEYNPEISKEQWLELLKDRKIFTDNAYFAIAAMYDFGGTATCRQLEKNMEEPLIFTEHL